MKKIFLVFLLCCCLPILGKSTSSTNSYYMQRAIEAYQHNDAETAIRCLSNELERNPTNGYAHMIVALVCSDNDAYGAMLQYAKSALQYLPKSEHKGKAGMCSLLSDLYLSAKDTARAIEYLQMMQKEMPKDEDAYRTLIDLYCEQGNFTEAMRYAKLFIKQMPNNVDAYLGMATVLEEEKNYEEALRYCDKALTKTEPKSADQSRALLARAQARIFNKQPSEALKDLLDATRIDIWNETEEIADRLNDTIPQELLDSLIAVHQADSANIYWDILLYDTYRGQNNYAKAVQTGFALLPRYTNKTLIYRIASDLENYIGDSELAERMLLKQLGVDSTSAGIFMRLEILYSEQGRYNEALLMAQKALSFNPRDYEKSTIYQVRGRVYLMQHNYQEAIDDFLAGMVADPDDCDFWFHIGRVYGIMNDSVKQAEAFEQGRKACALRGRELSAGAYVALGDTAAAYEAAQKMGNKARSAEQHYNAACIYAQIGYPEEALQELRLAFESGFRHFSHIAWDTDLDSLRTMSEFMELVSEFQQLTEREKQELRSTLDLELNY